VDQKSRKRKKLVDEIPMKVEIKQELEDFETENCIVIEPTIKVELVKLGEEFTPLEQFCESDDNKNESDSSAGPFEEFFSLKVPSKKKKYKKKSTAQSVKRDVTWHFCIHCDKKFYTEQTLQIHIDSVHFRLKNIKCDHCDFKTSTPQSLKGHIARVHDRTKPVPSAKGQPKTPCSICGLLVQKVSSHIRNVHTRPKNVFCDICGFGIFNLNRLRRHMYKHLSKETKRQLEVLTCDLCGARVHSKNSIKAHMNNIHLESGKNDYRCFCGKTYKAESYLKIHQKSHERQ
jgi:hypothetical protein